MQQRDLFIKDCILKLDALRDRIGSYDYQEYMRILHTLKGSLGALGNTNAVDYVHHLETAFTLLERKNLKISLDLQKFFMSQFSLLKVSFLQFASGVVDSSQLPNPKQIFSDLKKILLKESESSDLPQQKEIPAPKPKGYLLLRCSEKTVYLVTSEADQIIRNPELVPVAGSLFSSLFVKDSQQSVPGLVWVESGVMPLVPVDELKNQKGEGLQLNLQKLSVPWIVIVKKRLHGVVTKFCFAVDEVVELTDQNVSSDLIIDFDASLKKYVGVAA